MSHRKTDDLDLVVAVPLEDFPGPMKSLPGWRSHPKKEHCFFSPDGQQVDLVPAGAALVAQGYVEWPSGARMSLAGFDLAFAHATRELAGSTAVLVPPAPVIALLKMRAWLDRPHIREKDLADIAHLLVLYVSDDDVRHFEEEYVVDLGLEFEAVSPFLLGHDLGRIMADEHAVHVEEFVRKVSPEKLAAFGPPSLSSADHAERAIDVFRRGLDAGRRSPERAR